jgi:D-beta-D-heptose 7-phosphate kinase/D-beta-D-heptose 1-phosphate adenosyltransferase
LILGLNSDISVKRLKGNNRPIVPERDRALVTAALESVDYVCILNRIHPGNLLNLFNPMF